MQGKESYGTGTGATIVPPVLLGAPAARTMVVFDNTKVVDQWFGRYRRDPDERGVHLQ